MAKQPFTPILMDSLSSTIIGSAIQHINQGQIGHKKKVIKISPANGDTGGVEPAGETGGEDPICFPWLGFTIMILLVTFIASPVAAAPSDSV